MRTAIASLLLRALLFWGITPAQTADLPVKEAVPYKHGVGFFERSGRLGAGESACPDFEATEMNDVLKSLTVEERAAGESRVSDMTPWTRLATRWPAFRFILTLGRP